VRSHGDSIIIEDQPLALDMMVLQIGERVLSRPLQVRRRRLQT